MLSQFKDRVARRNKHNNTAATTTTTTNSLQPSPAPSNRLTKPRTSQLSKSPSPVFSLDSPLPESPAYSDLSATSRQHIKEWMLTPNDKDIEVSSPIPDKDLEADLPTEPRGRMSFVLSRSNSKTNSRANSKQRNSKTTSRSNSLSCFLGRRSSSNTNSSLDSRGHVLSGSQVDVEAAIRLLQEVKKSASPEDLAAIREALEPTTEAAPPTSSSGVSRRTSGVNSSLSSLMRRRSLVQTPGVATRSSPVDNHRRTWNSWRAPQLSAEQEAKWRPPPKQPSTDNLAALDLAEDARAQTPGSMDYSHLGTYKPGTLMVTNGPPSPAASSVHISRHNASMDEDNDYFATGGGDVAPTRTAPSRGHARTQSANAPEAAYPSPPSRPQRRSMVETTTVLSDSNRVFTSSQRPPPIDTSMRNAAAFAQEYQAYIPPSPFGNPVEFHTEADDSHADIYEEKQVCEEPECGQELHSNVFELAANGSEALYDGAGAHAKLSEQLIYGPRGRPAPRTTDSGYSSLGSLRRVATESPQGDAAALATTSVGSPHAMFSNSRQQTNSFELPIQGPRAGEVEQSLLATAPAQKVHARPAPLVIPTADSISDAILSPQSATQADSPRTQKRLQRRRPSQPAPPVVQSCQPVHDMSIPKVPDDVRVKFTRRLSSSPGMECLTQTYPTKEHELAGGPLDDAAAVSSSPTSTAPSPPIDFERPPTPPVQTRRRSRSLFHRRSVAEKMDRDEELPSPAVLDLGTIAAALGASPYDSAMMNAPKRESVALPTHPHQLGQLTRPKSIARMSSNAAAELARLRSKDRAMGEAEMARDQHYRKPRGDAGEAKAARRRPRSFYFDEAPPPVPAIDVSRFPGLQVAPVKQEREQSTQAQAQAQAQSGVDWEAHSQLWRQRRKSIGEGLRNHERPQAPQFKARPVSHIGSEAAAWGRYSGGLEYEYAGRGYGVGGSAGTRQVHSFAGAKSQHWKQDYGVDLSDVPVILQRV